MKGNEYSMGAVQARFAALRDRGVNTERRPSAKSTDVGGLDDLTAKTRDALAKAEATAHKTATAHLDALADGEATTADRDKAGIADARAQKALLAASDAHAAAIEANREEVGIRYAAEADDAGALLVDMLAEALEVAQRFAAARHATAAMASNNPADRLTPAHSGRVPGGATLANLIATTERETGLAEPFDRVHLSELAKLKRGEPATTVDGRTVDVLHGRVRVAYEVPVSVLHGERPGPFRP